ncbi:MAG: cobalamin biosynthesis protein CobS [Peptococcaceae bacterium BICA1-7]|nr:MAG: cobalamin biosynthesis protein CobS [Peptococcaceae bacterium BICA1-7]HBV99172.1 adenosylcobinamide-GDP ribazoletransferase [Desulfotomaculum sp.]
MEFLLAVQFLTKIPVTVRGPVDEKKLARSMAYFSLVGLLLGSCAAGLHALLSLVFAPPVSILAALAFMIMITGNLHGDGLMDTADGLFSGKPREGMLEIMKDSRTGSHGVMAGALVLLTKFVLLGQMPVAGQGMALALAAALGRWSQVYGAAFYDYARPAGGTGSFTARVGYREIIYNSLTAIILTLFLLKLYGLILLAAVLSGTALLEWYIAKKIGGITGDTLGATSECIEVLTLVTLLAIFTKTC